MNSLCCLLKRLQQHSHVENKVYEAASGVIMPSEAEGFGLAIIEGAHHGKPLILRDIPVSREIAGDHATYFSGLDPEPLADCIEQ